MTDVSFVTGNKFWDSIIYDFWALAYASSLDIDMPRHIYLTVIPTRLHIIQLMPPRLDEHLILQASVGPSRPAVHLVDAARRRDRAPFWAIVPEDGEPVRGERGLLGVLVRLPGAVVGAGAELVAGGGAGAGAGEEVEEGREDGQAGADEAGVDFEGRVEHDGDEVPGYVGLGEGVDGYGAGDADCGGTVAFCSARRMVNWVDWMDGRERVRWGAPLTRFRA